MRQTSPTTGLCSPGGSCCGSAGTPRPRRPSPAYPSCSSPHPGACVPETLRWAGSGGAPSRLWVQEGGGHSLTIPARLGPALGKEPGLKAPPNPRTPGWVPSLPPGLAEIASPWGGGEGKEGPGQETQWLCPDGVQGPRGDRRATLRGCDTAGVEHGGDPDAPGLRVLRPAAGDGEEQQLLQVPAPPPPTIDGYGTLDFSKFHEICVSVQAGCPSQATLLSRPGHGVPSVCAGGGVPARPDSV